MSGEVVWSINIMIIILLISVAYVIYWIFMYDTWYPNSITIHSDPSESTHGTFISDGGMDTENSRV